MKIFTPVLIAATLLSASAFAQSYDPDLGTGNILLNQTASAQVSAFGDARAQAVPAVSSHRQSGLRSSSNGIDQNLRFQLHREQSFGQF